MQVIQCPSCQTYTPADREECLSCGSALHQSEPRAQPPIAANQEVTCPKCGLNQLTANKKGYGLGRAAIGGILLGGLGLLGGFVGAGKVRVTCLQCGHAWAAGKRR